MSKLWRGACSTTDSAPGEAPAISGFYTAGGETRRLPKPSVGCRLGKHASDRAQPEPEGEFLMNDCIFCDILAGTLPASIVHQDHACTALLDIQPINPGHTLVIPNRHTAYLADLDEESSTQLFHTAQRVAAALRKAGLRCEGVNLLLADGEAAGQEVFHIHLHVVPRFQRDGFGFKFPSQYTIKPERGELDRVAEKLRKVM